jgi:hypothetical protein
VTNAGGLDANAASEYARRQCDSSASHWRRSCSSSYSRSCLGIGADETGVLEKLVLAVIAAGLIWVAFRVRHLGSPHGPHSA